MTVPGSRDAESLQELSREIRAIRLPRRVRLMEVCGGHTAVIHRFVLPALLPPQIELLSGPGCPVCVTPAKFVDEAVALAAMPNLTITTFGDLLRVPGSHGSLADARARGGNVRVIYSAGDALDLARSSPSQTIVLLGIGFETTACTVAAAVAQAVDESLPNFRMLSALKTMPAALRVLLSGVDVRVDGLILPGHVLTVTGTKPFEFLAEEFGVPGAVAGFEPSDLLESIWMLSRQLSRGCAEVEIQYRRSVAVEGNRHAQNVIARILEPSDAEWRGLGSIPGSGLSIRSEYAAWDARDLVPDLPQVSDNPACRCGDILTGRAKPIDCPLFGTVCNPESPQGACMVSSEGACAVVLQYSMIADA